MPASAIKRWAQTLSRYLTLTPDASRKAPARHSPAPDAPGGERIAPSVREIITRGRAVLSEPSQGRGQIEADRDPRQEDSAAARLLALLWDADADVRQSAALALPGGDGVQAHVGEYGHFAGAFGRGLNDNHVDALRGETMPLSASARYDRVAASLRALLDQNIGEIRGMSNMNYSFLSSALYLAVLATCRDTVCAVGRLRVAEAHPELCRLLWNLSQIGVLRRFNGQDLDTLAGATGRALAALPPDALTDFWHSLTCAALPRRIAVAPALRYFKDVRAVPYLLDALNAPGSIPELTGLIAACLGRLEDARALPALRTLSQSRDRLAREQARTAIALIERAGRLKPHQTLLRPASDSPDRDSETMLRSAPVNQHEADPPRQLLRVAQMPAVPASAAAIAPDEDTLEDRQFEIY